MRKKQLIKGDLFSNDVRTVVYLFIFTLKYRKLIIFLTLCCNSFQCIAFDPIK